VPSPYRRRSPPSPPSSSSPLTSLARPSTSHRVLTGHHRRLIVIFKGGRSEGDDFVIIAVVGSRTHPNNAFRCVFANSYRKNSKRRSSRHVEIDSTWSDDRQILIGSDSVAWMGSTIKSRALGGTIIELSKNSLSLFVVCLFFLSFESETQKFRHPARKKLLAGANYRTPYKQGRSLSLLNVATDTSWWQSISTQTTSLSNLCVAGQRQR
jgi:hypothetical protein